MSRRGERVTAATRLEGHLATLTAPLEALAGRVALSGCAPLSPGVWAVRAGVPYNAIARALSQVEGGLWMATGTGLTWVNGRECCWLVEWRGVAEISRAREIAAGLGVQLRSWTLGGVARSLLKWTGIKKRHWGCSQGALADTRWAYHANVPGAYDRAVLCDLAGAYHQVVERLPSPKVDWLTDGPVWLPLSPDEAARWSILKEAARAHKGLRTRLLGCMIGGGAGCATWHKGRRLKNRTGAGPLVSAGLLVARTVYELCALEAADCQAWYANTDCVVTGQGEKRHVWERYGYAYRVEAQGPADLVALGCYKVGDKQTAWYGAGGRYPVAYPADPVPSRLTLSYWH